MAVIPPLPSKKYQIIYSDPPWQYDSAGCLAGRSALDGKMNTHYPTMTMDELKSIDIPRICDDNALLFLWVTNPLLHRGIHLLIAWGFVYVTVGFVWHKQRTNPGSYTLSECELCLIGKRERIPVPRGSRNEHQFLSKMRGAHSAKPDEIRDRIFAMFPEQSKIELFARQKAEGWDSWGNEIDPSSPLILNSRGQVKPTPNSLFD